MRLPSSARGLGQGTLFADEAAGRAATVPRDGEATAVYFVQAYKAKGSRLVGQASEGHRYAEEALAAARRVARWRAGVVVFAQEVDDEGVQRGRPAVLAIHGLVPDGWLAADRRAA